MVDIMGFIPARMASERFPGKPLAMISGKPMIQRVYDGAKGYSHFDYLGVCTPDKEIAGYCGKQNIPCIMTSSEHERATDRVHEAATIKNAHDRDVIVVVQGDEPLLHWGMLDLIVTPVLACGTDVSMLVVPLMSAEEHQNPNLVKVVMTSAGRTLYTSREPIPFARQNEDWGALSAVRIGGMFAYRYHALKMYARMEPHPLEIAEMCDINRLIGNDIGVKACEMVWRLYHSVDRPEDIARVERALEIEIPEVPTVRNMSNR